MHMNVKPVKPQIVCVVINPTIDDNFASLVELPLPYCTKQYHATTYFKLIVMDTSTLAEVVQNYNMQSIDLSVIVQLIHVLRSFLVLL